ncbi:MAG: 6-carboxytetrahydropterin synthase [Campylobacterales bacterium]|nr:6-carboxytetrahydropterin synthase [Campylobacterales bacterium]
MLIRKQFKFENAHIVRGCSSQRCRASLHGHSYIVEVLFESNFLDHGQMVYDFGLMKRHLKELIDGFDHAITLWDGDDSAYIEAMTRYSDRYVLLPVSPSAEQFSRVFFVLIDRLMALTCTVNGEREVRLHSVIVHETATGCAQGFREDAYNAQMGLIDLERIIYSEAVRAEWSDPQLMRKLIEGEAFINPTTV